MCTQDLCDAVQHTRREEAHARHLGRKCIEGSQTRPIDVSVESKSSLVKIVRKAEQTDIKSGRQENILIDAERTNQKLSGTRRKYISSSLLQEENKYRVLFGSRRKQSPNFLWYQEKTDIKFSGARRKNI